MNKTLVKINALLQETDIEGLLEAGAPEDEYSSEAAALTAIFSALEESNFDIKTVETLVTEVWTNSFNLAEKDLVIRKSAFENLARRIVETIKIS